MKLSKVDFYLDWPKSIKVIYLRRFVMENLMSKGLIIRWSIIDIKDSEDSYNIKKLKIYAVLAN